MPSLAANAWQGTEAPYAQTVAVQGLLASDTPVIDLALSGTYAGDRERLEDFARLYRAVTAQDSLTVWAASRPAGEISLRILCIRK